MSEPLVRRGRSAEAEPVAALLHGSAEDMYDRFTGGRDPALALLAHAFSRPGNSASSEVVWVADLNGRMAGAMAGFPVLEAPSRARAFLALALRQTPLWRWPGALRLYVAGARAAPGPPRAAFYVDALAIARGQRRRGAARALLAEAERQARIRGLRAVALDTSTANEPARALYASTGFDEVAYRPPSRQLPGFVALVKRLG